MLKITASFVLGFLIVIHGLSEFTTHADHQGKEGMSMTEKKELVGELSKTSSLIGGRKMAVGNGELATSTTTSATSSSKNSGGMDNNKASKDNFHKEPQEKMNRKCEIKTTKASANEIGPLRSEPRKNYSKLVDEESRRLLEAERKIVNLMRKDYKGSSEKGMGRRKPPINNNEPRH